MLQSWFKMALRHIRTGKLYVALNLIGLATGIAVAIIIGLWLNDELRFDHYHPNHDRLAQVMFNEPTPDGILTSNLVCAPLAGELRSKYGNDFRRVALVWQDYTHILVVGEKKLPASGVWAQPDLPDMLQLKMVSGSRSALHDPSSALLTRSLAKALFGDTDPIGRTIRIDNHTDQKVGGVFEDLPENTSFHGTKIILPWDKAINILIGVKDALPDWGTRYWRLYVEMNPNASIVRVSQNIKNIPGQHSKDAKQEIFLHPMNRWHLYGDFTNGKISGGRIRIVWLFTGIGLFVLALACINFMNLSTARSERRAKEVGIRKTIGSLRGHLIGQFLSEAILITAVACLLALLIAIISLPFFNRLAGKNIAFPWTEPAFWLSGFGFMVIIGLIAGSYPAFYLSRFRPVKVLKGDFKTSPLAALPRKILVVIQFTVSIAFIIGTVLVYRQIQYAKDRPVGYTRQGLLSIRKNSSDLYQAKYDALRADLLHTGAVLDMAQSGMASTETIEGSKYIEWEGKDPNFKPLITICNVTHDYGHTIGWQVVQGRDFSRDFPTDSTAVIINETAARLIKMKFPIGHTMRVWGKNTIIGVVKDMVTASPYQHIQPAVYILDYNGNNFITVRVSPSMPMRTSLTAVEQVFRKYNPTVPFEYTFVDDDYARKFSDEQRVASLSGLFTILAILISCLGLFGLAAYRMEQRTKEIGIRKVLGAPVAHLWRILTKDFIVLVLLSCVIAVPLSIAFLHQWLRQYEYRTDLPWYTFIAACGGALGIALLTISYHAVKATRTNPIESLRSE